MFLSVKMKNVAVYEPIGWELVWVSMGWSTAILAKVATNDSLGEALLAISKETVRNSWDISNAMLGHKYHQNHSNRSSEWSKHLQQKWLIQSVNGWVDQLFYWHQHSGSCMVTQKLDLDQMSERSIGILKDTYITLTFCCKFWVYSFHIIYILGKWLQKEDIADCCALCFDMGVWSQPS